MPQDKCAWILPCFGFEHLNGMKGTLDGSINARPLPYSIIGSS
jgi:hypothetical protein